MTANSSTSSGVLLVDKPAGISSADVTNRIKKCFKISKIGHGGTLDPFATGLLVVLLGEATKVARFLLDGEKKYLAKLQLGTSTNTGDPTGEVLETAPVPKLSKAEWETILRTFLGLQQQTPPQFSAIKVKGKPLYEYARKGEEVEVKSRAITIHDIQLVSVSDTEITFRAHTSAGTYIRVLGEEIAKKAGTVGHLLSLCREGSSKFSLDDAQSLEKVCETPFADLKLQPLQKALVHLPQITCSQVQATKLRMGNLNVFSELKKSIQTPGYFLVSEESSLLPVAVANFHPMITPECSIERVFDPRLLGL